MFCKASKEVYRKHTAYREYLRKKYRDPALAEKNRNCRIAVILHLFYESSWKEIKEYLKNLSDYSFDLTVTVTEDRISARTLSDITAFCPEARILHCPNRGYDLWPFFHALKDIDLDSYDIVFKLQSKSTKRRSIYIYDQYFLRRDWFVNLFEGILSAKNVHRTIDTLYHDPEVGLVAAENLIVKDPDHKRRLILQYAQENGYTMHRDYRFVAGTCFAAKASALKEIQSLHFENADFRQEITARGLSHAHFIERYLCADIENHGLALRGNPACTVRRFLRKPMTAICYRLSSERLHEQDLILDDEWFLWQLDNRLIRWKYDRVALKKLKYSREHVERKFTECAPYLYLKGDVEGYEKYCQYHRENGLPIMSRERFDTLRDSIARNGYNPKNIIVINDRNVIMDGQHRACCLCDVLGEDAKVRVLRIRFLGLKNRIRAMIPNRLLLLYYKRRDRKK